MAEAKCAPVSRAGRELDAQLGITPITTVGQAQARYHRHPETIPDPTKEKRLW